MPAPTQERMISPSPTAPINSLDLFEKFRLDQIIEPKREIKTVVPDIFCEAPPSYGLESFLPEIEPFERGSYLTQIGPREWIMTQEGASTPYDVTYDANNPMPMRAIHAPGAGEQARAIMELGRTEDELIQEGQVVDMQTSMRHTRAFIEVFAKKGTDFGGKGENIATLSTGLGWNRQTRNEDAMGQMTRSVIGEDAIIVWFGPHKFLAFAKGTVDPDELRERMIDAPIAAYRRYHPEWAGAQEDIQKIRKQIDTGRDFIDYYEERNNTLEMPFKQNRRLSFEWMYRNSSNGMKAINPDGEEQDMLDLILKNHYAEDTDMRNMLYALYQILPLFKAKGLVVFHGLFDSTAVCCGFSTNAQQKGLLDGQYDFFESEIASPQQNITDSYLLFARSRCNACGEKFSGEHKCEEKTIRKEMVVPK